ncbi:hypothetical protein LPJ79_002009 [Coemansia sp. RSA 1821]|nr:hypothetical protein LPJ79_002009 [Coemansia sp. RSA 1821]
MAVIRASMAVITVSLAAPVGLAMVASQEDLVDRAALATADLVDLVMVAQAVPATVDLEMAAPAMVDPATVDLEMVAPEMVDPAMAVTMQLVDNVLFGVGGLLESNAINGSGGLIELVDNLVTGLLGTSLNLHNTVDALTSILENQVPCLLDTVLPEP